MVPLSVRGLWLLSVVLLCSSPTVYVSAQGFTKPDNATINPPVFIQIAFNKVSKVDGVEQLFNADFYMQIFWLDLERQDWYKNNDTTNGNTGPNVDYTTGVGLLPPIAAGNFEFTPWLNGMYDPDLEFVNGDGDIQSQGTYYTITAPPFVTQYPEKMKAMGLDLAQNQSYIWTVKDYRYIGSFTTPLDLHNFPYDRQFVQLVIESQWADSSQMYLVYTNTSKEFLAKSVPDTNTSQIIGWDVVDLSVTRTWHQYNLFPGGNYSRLVIALELARQPKYYVAKIVIGVVLLVLMCVCVFSLAVDEADRQMGTLQVFAGIVTFLFVASADVPKIPYLTRLDAFFLVSFFFTAFMLVTHSVSYFWRSDEGKEHDDDEDDGAGANHAHAHAHAGAHSGSGSSLGTQSKLTHITYGPMGSQQDMNGSTSSIRQRKSQNVPEDGTNHVFVELAPTTAFGDHTSATAPTATSPSSPTSTDSVEQKHEADAAFNVTKPAHLASHSTLGSSSKAGSFSRSGSRSKKRGGRLGALWRRSSCWRRSDTLFVTILFVAYAIACAVILGQPSPGATRTPYEVLTDWPEGIWTSPPSADAGY